MKFILISNDNEVAKLAEKNEIDYLMVDLEIEGKSQRQKGRNTWITNHNIRDIPRIRNILNKTKIMVRINPLGPKTEFEIDEIIKNEVDAIMLPMFKTEQEVSEFLKYVGGNIECHLLLETVDGVKNLEKICKLKSIKSIHIGLNDLHLELNLDFMFELLTTDFVENICSILRKNGIPFGIGGVGRVHGNHSVPATLLINEYSRLGSTQVIISRDFLTALQKSENKDKYFEEEISLLRKQFAIVKKEKRNEIGRSEDFVHAVRNRKEEVS